MSLRNLVFSVAIVAAGLVAASFAQASQDLSLALSSNQTAGIVTGSYDLTKVALVDAKDLALADGAGEGVSADPLIGLILAIVPSFGLGHWYMGDQAGFMKWLLLEGICVLADIVLGFVGLYWLSYLAYLASVVVYVFQLYDYWTSQMGGSLSPRGSGGDVARDEREIAAYGERKTEDFIPAFAFSF
jgi:hypothetical protein